MNSADVLQPLSPRQERVLMVVDVVESVRLMEDDEPGFVRRWQQLAAGLADTVVPRHGGRVVKSLGDGLMLEFGTARAAVEAAFAAHSLAAADAAPSGPRLQLRAALHRAEFVADERDIYGAGVNLTARLATLAGATQTVVSATVRDELTDGLDADLEDLGDCYLKHVREPVRAYRASPPGQPAAHAPAGGTLDLRPTIAVVPFDARSNEPEHFVVGEVIADGLIEQLARSPDLRVISRLSTTAFRGRADAVTPLRTHLDATFVLAGSYVASGQRVTISAQLTDTRQGEIAWAQRLAGDLMDLVQPHSELLAGIADAACRALIDREAQRALTQPLPRLDSCSLLLGGITHMHRASRHDFERSREALELLAERHNRAAAPRAWMAKWHIMRLVRGMSEAPADDARRALESTARALDAEPDSTLALAIRGHALCHLTDDTQAALRSIDDALRLNPNEALAWLYRSVWSSMWGAADASLAEARAASALSPIDPLRYYHDAILAVALGMAGEYEQAIDAAQRSLKANRHHQPTLRVLLHAQVNLGRMDDARATLRLLQQEMPGLTVSGYLALGGAQSSSRRAVADALRKLGVPEH